MSATIVPKPVTLAWSNFDAVDKLPKPGEDAHIDINFAIGMKQVRKVGSHFMAPDPFDIGVSPLALVLKTANQTADLLAHEQGHYDIGILVARALGRDLAAVSEGTPAGFKKEVDRLFGLHRLTRMKPVQEKYDTDTNHSRNTQEQQRWAGLIQAALASASATHLDNLPL